jgi:hypothetical protein
MRLIDNMLNKGPTAGTPAAAEAAPSSDGKKRTKRRKPEEMLASVVRESTVNAAIDLLSRNEPFILPGGNSWWVALALPVENIGGLSKKQQKDEAKGSLIELINHDLIQTITTRQLLDEEVLGIIPTPQTLERMGEYSLLTGATYHWMVLSPSQDRQELLVNAVIAEAISYAEAVSISNGSHNLADRLPQAWAWTEAIIDTPPAPQGTAANAGVDSSAGPIAATSQPGDDDSGPAAAASPPDDSVDYDAPEDRFLIGTDSSPDMFDEELSGADMAPPATEDLDDDESVAYDDEMDEDDDGDEDGDVVTAATGETPSWQRYVEQNRDRTFTEPEVRHTIARRFLPDDLDLEIPFTEFEGTFDTRAPSVRLEFSDDSTDWLGEQVALMAKQANAELEKLHSDHRKELRQLFVETMSLHAESVMREVDDQREGSVYQRLSAAAAEEFAERQAKAPAEVSAERAEIIQRYERDADERAEVAAVRARQAYWDRFRPELERRIADVASQVERRNEERLLHQRQIVLQMRRKDARTRMQLGTTRAFQLLSEREAAHRQAEMELLQRWNAELTRFISDNREHDIARAETLAEQLRLDNRVVEIQTEHAQRVKKLKVEHESRLRTLETEMERDRERADARLRKQEEGWKGEVATKDQQLNSTNRLYADLQAQMQRMNDSIGRHNLERDQERERDRRSYAAAQERDYRIHRRSIRILLALAALAVLVFTVAGIVIGWAIGSW